VENQTSPKLDFAHANPLLWREMAVQQNSTSGCRLRVSGIPTWSVAVKLAGVDSEGVCFFVRLLQFHLPAAHSSFIAFAGIGDDQQPRGLRIALRARRFSPA
jgi:hypothetical protein